ncbi:MAG: rhomboid family intramembrane serine protease [bacterium]
MIPLKDDNPTRHFPLVTVVLIAINVAIYIVQFLLPEEAGRELVERFGAIPADILGTATGDPRGDRIRSAGVLTLFSSMFLHGSPLHLAGNMLYLWIFGNNIEDRLGRFRFPIFYLLAGLGAHAGHIATSMRSVVPTIGASGAIAGVLGAYVLLYPKARVLVLLPLGFFSRTFWVPSVIVLGVWFLMQFLNGLPALGGADRGGVAWFAHIGGFVAGMILIWPFLAGTAQPARARRRDWDD